MVNYRKIFEKHYNMKIPKGYVIHHINFNREDNRIENLLLLPAKLHSQYHFYKTAISELDIPKLINTNSFNGISYNTNAIINYMKTYKECCKWYDYKMYLDGIILNIHNISL